MGLPDKKLRDDSVDLLESQDIVSVWGYIWSADGFSSIPGTCCEWWATVFLGPT
jgi:hypothetical protein